MVFPIFPMVMSNKAKEVGNGGLWKTSKFEISNGHNWAAIWSYRAVSTTPGIARTSSCSGEGSQGAWGLGRWEKVEKCFIFGPFFFELFWFFSKMKKVGEIGQICSDWALIDSPPFFLNFWPTTPGESKTRCGDSFWINMSSIQANLTDFVFFFICFLNKFKIDRKTNVKQMLQFCMSP